MIPDVVGQSTSRFDERFLLTALVPTAVFAPAITAVSLLGTGHLGSTANWYMGLPAVLQVLSGLVVTAAVWFLATIVASQWANIVRFYEGYPLLRLFALLERRRAAIGAHRRWHGRPTGIAAHLTKREKLRRRALAETERTSVPGSNYDPEPLAEVYEQYPPAAHRVLPTSLGNILRAAEDYGYHRYGFDSIHLWPRLAAVLPNEYLADVERTVIEYQTPLVVSFGSALLAVASLPLMKSTIPTALFIAIFTGSASLSLIAYRMSFQAAKDYGDHLRTAVDLYRKDLLERWWPELLAIDSDRLRLEALRQFVMTGKKDSIKSLAERKRKRLHPISRYRRHEEEVREEDVEDETPVPMFGVRLSLIAAITIAALVLARGISARVTERHHATFNGSPE